MSFAHRVRPGLCLAVLLVTVFATACREGHAGTSLDGMHELRISTADLHFNGPDSVPGGLTRVRLANTSAEWHHVQLIRIENGHGYEEFEQAVSSGRFTEPWMTFVGGPNVPSLGQESEVLLDLEPGLYGMICFIPDAEGVPHVMRGMVRRLVVGPRTGEAVPEPAFDVRMTLVDYEFPTTPEITAGRRTIRVENVADQPHEVVVARLAPGRTIDDVLAYIATMSGPMPAELVGGTTVIAPGGVNYMTIDFTSGEYVLICFAHDAEGTSHVRHGMHTQFSVR